MERWEVGVCSGERLNWGFHPSPPYGRYARRSAMESFRFPFLRVSGDGRNGNGPAVGLAQHSAQVSEASERFAEHFVAYA